MSKQFGFRLYLITDGALSSGVEEALKAGVKAVQLRDKQLSTRELLSLSYKMREITAQYGAKLFINDRADIALSVDADGVHLGQASMPVEAVRKIAGDKLLIGVSTHTYDEAHAAERGGADFITFGPVYETPSKLQYGPPVGIHALKNVCTQLSIPVFAIGGITVERVRELTSADAHGVAMIRGILEAPDIKKAATDYREQLGERS